MENCKQTLKTYLSITCLWLGLATSLSASPDSLHNIFRPYLRNIAWVREVIQEDKSSERAKSLKPLAVLDENWLNQARFSSQIPQDWCGFWTRFEYYSLDVSPQHVYYLQRLFRVKGVCVLQDLALIKIHTDQTTLVLALQRRVGKDGVTTSGQVYELSMEKYKEPMVHLLLKHQRSMVQVIPGPLYGQYGERRMFSRKLSKPLATLGKTHMVIFNRRWNIKFRGEIFKNRQRAYRLFVEEAKTGRPGYVLLKKRYPESNYWDLSLTLEMTRSNLNSFVHYLGQKYLKSGKTNFSVFWVVFFCLLLLILYRFFRRRIKKYKSERTRSRLALVGLRAQLNPHFLFNALSSIQDLVNQDNKPAANRYFNEMAELLRYVVDSSKSEYTPLTAELEALEKYCSLESLRLPFAYSFDINPELNPNVIEIPTMLLQPFIENAILHGLRPGSDPKELKISVWPEGLSRIGISILDNGIGIEEAKRRQKAGIDLRGHQGMATAQQRIDLLNEGKREKITLKVIDRSSIKPDQHGTKVQFSIPI